MLHIIADVVRQRAVLRLYLQQTVLETLIGEVLRILRIHYADTIDDEAIGVHVGGNRRFRILSNAKGYRPDTVGAAGHLLATSKLHVDHY